MTDKLNKIIGVMVVVIGVYAGIQLILAGNSIYSSADDLKRLRSIRGTSVAESYYQSMGEYGVAYSRVFSGIGFGIVAISLGLGGNLFFKTNSKLLGEEVNNFNPNLDKTSPSTSSVIPNTKVNSIKMIKCPTCQNKCSSKAVACPKCKTELIGKING